MLGLKPRLIGLGTLEEEADLHAQSLRDAAQTTGGDAVDALLVFVRLLVGDADQLGHLLLGQAQHDPPLAHPRPDNSIDVLRPRTRCLVAGLRRRHCHVPASLIRQLEPWKLALKLPVCR